MSDGLKLVTAILLDGGVETLRKLGPELFMDEEASVYTFVRNHFRRYAQLPSAETVQTDTGVQLPDITESVPYYEKKVRDRYLYGLLSNDFTRLRTAIMAYNMDAAREVIASMRALSREHSADEDLRNMDQAITLAVRQFEFAKENPGISGVPAGWPRYDAMTGGYQPGDLVSLVGRMGMGKTYVLLHMADAAWAAGYSVLFVTMEMPILQLARRSVAMRAHINPEYIRKGRLSSRIERQFRSTITQFQRDNYAELQRYHIYAGGFSKKVDDVDILIQEHNPDITLIDSAYLMQPDNAYRAGRYEKVSYVIDTVKRMTITHNRPIVITSHFSKAAGEKGRQGNLQTIGYTDTIGTHSSLVIALKEGKPPFQSMRRTLELLKGREGEAGEIEINFKFASMDFSELGWIHTVDGQQEAQQVITDANLDRTLR